MNTEAKTGTEPDNSDAEFDILFSVRLSIRYHDQRLAHFDRLHRLSNAVTILLAGVIFMEIGGAESPWYVQTFAAFGAILTAADLVVGFSKAADLHRNLKRRFCELEIALMSKTCSAEEAQLERRKIETDEPPIYTALSILCRQELCIAHECENVYEPLRGWPKVTAQWLHWPNVASTMKLRSTTPS